MKEGKLARARRVLLGDSVATMVGAMFGTSPSAAFLESASGVAAGGRTGLTSVVVAVLFAAPLSLVRLFLPFPVSRLLLLLP
ncbi:guanine/hypoxanthine permease PbuO [Paenibacillus larvae subsp. larvae DSM 25430]|nr:guanine/hypoxanthine permease PbuO [Paenibacillus larvae subsp. larvae DSM 25430]